MSVQKSATSSYIPSIDGLRAVAILAVFLHHIVSPVFPSSTFIWWGWTGVDLFFVISGYLITGILYDTLNHRHYFRNFYIRRTLRIFPLFYAVWLALLLASLVWPVSWNRYDLYDALYLLNVFSPGAALGQHAQSMVISFHRSHGKLFTINIAHFWSLSLEEQFYLVWPSIMWLCRNRRKMLFYVCGAAVVIGPLLRTYIYLHSSPAELAAEALIVSSYTRFDTLLVGAGLALWMRSSAAPSGAGLRRAAHLLMGVPLALFLVLHTTIGLRWPVTITHPFIAPIDLTLFALGSAGLVLICHDASSLVSRTLTQRPLIHLGRISYGFYIFHYLLLGPIVVLEGRASRFHCGLLVALAAFAGTYVLAELSYRYFESRFLVLKDRWTAHDHATAPVSLEAA